MEGALGESMCAAPPGGQEGEEAEGQVQVLALALQQG